MLDSIIIANRYPGNNKYGGEFIHARLKSYLLEMNIAVVEIGSFAEKVTETVFEDITVFRGSFKLLDSILAKNPARVVGVHSPSEATLDIILKHYRPQQIITWHHGAESLDLSKHHTFMASDTTIRRWRQIVQSQKPKLQFVKDLVENKSIAKVFVSNYLLDKCLLDTQAVPASTRIIHNNVTKEFFEDVKIPPKLKKKRVLVLKDFSHTKAADVTMGVINRLAMKTDFEDFEFSVFGFGQNWDAWTDALRHYTNVNLVHGYIAQIEISQLMKKHDIFLGPSRHETQGLLMCEGMASGLLCVVNKCTGVPEFISNKEGILVDSNSPKDICEQLHTALQDSHDVEQRRINANKRAKMQCGVENTVLKEIELFKDRF